LKTKKGNIQEHTFLKSRRKSSKFSSSIYSDFEFGFKFKKGVKPSFG